MDELDIYELEAIRINYSEFQKGAGKLKKQKTGSWAGGPDKPFPGGKGDRFKNCVEHFKGKGKTEEQAKGACAEIARLKYGKGRGK